MFQLDLDSRLTAWTEFRKKLEKARQPLLKVAEFWSNPPYVAYNKDIDPYNPRSWPTPWEIIQRNRYDDLTKAVMMAWTLIYTERYRNSTIHLIGYLDTADNMYYNCVIVDDEQVLNYKDNLVIPADNLPPSFRLENLVELKRPK